MESRKQTNMIENIISQYEENGSSTKTKIGVIKQLFKQNLISQDTYAALVKNENAGDDSDNNSENSESHDIRFLKEQLLKENVGHSILWLQDVLIEACNCKIYIGHRDCFKDSDVVVEPVPYCYSSNIKVLAIVITI